MGRPTPLDGIRVLDLSTWQTGAGGTALLADLGADVVKIEAPGAGDPGRGIHVVPGEEASGENLFVEVMNRNKRGLALDLKHPDGRALFLTLVEHADVVAENFRVGTMERLGIGYATLRERNPRIVLASVNGFGPAGPDADVGVFDIMGHSRSGLMYLLSGVPEPRYIGAYGVADHVGAVFFAYAALAGLVARGVHGFGQHVSASQLGGLMTVQTLPINRYLATGGQPWTDAPYEPSALFNFYAAADGAYLCLGCTPEGRYWDAVCDVLERPDLPADPRFADQPARTAHAGELIAAVAETIRTRPRDAWLERLRARAIPVTPVQQYSDLAEDPQVLENGYIEHGQVGVPIGFSETPARRRRGAPGVGEHTDEVLAEWGLAAEEIRRLHAAGAIA
jgi:crotonobetainyl-CoA:carnitine CoA-transferase CaiB-like acyl-CoA transferase